MEHKTWDIPAEKQRSSGKQSLDDFKFTLVLWWEYLSGPFKSPPIPLTDNIDPNKTPVVIVPGFIWAD